MSATVPYAYGLSFPGLEDAAYLMQVPPGDWRPVHVRHALDGPGAARLTPGESSSDRLERSSEIGRVVLDRHERTARYYTPEPLGRGGFARGYLDTAATAFARWDGRDAFHAGAFVAGGGAWAVVGGSGDGKSTLLAALALAGRDVLGDELLVVDGDRAFTSVRCVDLRPPAVELLGLRDGLLPALRGDKSRLPLDPMEPAVPFRGWIFLSWRDESSVVRLQAADVLARITAMRLWGDVPTDPRRLLHLASLPSFELRRPQVGTDVHAVVEDLSEVAA